MSNPLLNAVLSKNAAALQSLFDSGVSLNVVEYKHKGASKMIDASVWAEAIISDWKEGAEILLQHLPYMNDMEKVFQAIRSGSSNVLPVLWNHLESIDELIYTQETQTRILQSVMGGMGQIYNENFEKKDMRPTIRTLVQLGVDLSGALPGDFEFRDFRPEGHSIWTRALGIRRFEYVEDFWPTADMLDAWPRLNEVVFDMLDFALEDEIPFHDPTLGKTLKKLLLRFLKEFGSQWIKQVSDEPPPNLFRVLKSEGGEIVKTEAPREGASTHQIFSIARGVDAVPPTLLEYLCSPLKYKPAAWLRLPLYVSQKEREILWPIWQQLHDLDPHQTWLNVLSGNPSVETTEILKLVHSEMPVFWQKYWFTVDQSGLSADQKWKGFGGEVFYE